MAKKVSPNRRKSIAVVSQNQPSLVPKNRRRAHSIVPGASLSPLAKARRSLAPRKSILKSAVNALNIDPSSQQSTSTLDDANATQSMEITQDFSAPVRENTTRKSFGRRVSFASHSQVRMFETNHTNSTGSPQSSPGSISSPDPPQQVISNENDYPGQNGRRRRSSVRYSIAGSEDMDMTTVMDPNGFQARGSAILDEEFDYDEDDFLDDDNMEVTEAIQGNFARKRSLSMGRQPLSQVESGIQPEEEGNTSRSDIGEESMQSEGVSEDPSQGMEFTIPLGQSLRPPPEQDEAWLALKQMTHSGNEPSEPELPSDDSGMDLNDAMSRLRRARDSLPLSQLPAAPNEEHEDSFTSTEDSFNADENDGNKTLNLSQVMGRVSIGTNARMSLGYQDSNMDESEVYGDIARSTPRHSLVPSAPPSDPQQPPPRPSVFQPPPPNQLASSTTQAGKAPSTAFSFTPRPPSPSKSKPTPSPAKPKPTFSAAFAPPVARPSPKKSSAAPSSQIPTKRPRSGQDDDIENIDADKPSPAKKPTLASKWLGAAGVTESAKSTPEPTLAKSLSSKPKPLSPSKRAPFQSAAGAAQAKADASSQPPSAIRRPSGYFARRKSLAVGFNTPSSSQENAMPSTTRAPSSPKKKLAGRASLGSAPADAWQRFDRNVGAGSKVAEKEHPAPSQKEAEKEVETTTRQAAASAAPAPVSIVDEQRTASPVRFMSPVIIPASEAPAAADLSEEMEIDIDATQQWREGVQQGEYVEEEDTPAISVAQFFQLTGIKFMDDITAPRRSVHPGAQPIRQPRNAADIPLAEYVTAMAIDIPQLDLYSRVSKDLEGWMEKSKVVFAQAEEEASKVTPELFVEYARADEEGQVELLHQLNLIRTHTRYLARSDWYDWKYQWVEGLRVTAEEAFRSLENDARALEGLKKMADAVLPDLEKEYDQLMRELEQEQAEIDEIENSDQDYLNELKATVAEQSIEIEALQAELSEATDQSKWIQEKVVEIGIQQREAQNTISTAERVLLMKQTSTRSEVFRLKGELEALEDLHMFRITKVTANVFEYVYASLFLVSIPCKNFNPIVTKINITRYGKQGTKLKDDFPKLSSFLLNTAKYLVNESEDLTVRQIVHRLNDYWSSCSQLRSQLTLLNVKYPLDITFPSLESKEIMAPCFKAMATVMFPAVQGKAFISFVFSFDTIAQWPLSLESLNSEVEVAYGPMDRSSVMKAVMDRLSQATPAENYAPLLDACIEAQELYH